MPSAPQPAATVLIATRDRREGVRRTLEALAAQSTTRPFEVVVVDDGSAPPVEPGDLSVVPGARLLRATGAGPARARNLGLADAAGEVIAFTDDDTVPDSGWLEAALAYLDGNPEAVGVEGPILSLPYDALYELSLEATEPGAYFTANVAYRRHVLEAVHGFDESFPFPHCEDLDLAYRAQRLGPIGYAQTMTIRHVPRPITVREFARRGRYVASEFELLKRHPDRYGRAAHLPPVLFGISNAIRYWIGATRREGSRLRDPRRAVRLAAMAVSHTLTTVTAALGRTMRR
jgi:glycosyltransferase involved in cell wall biosynthesis